MRKVFFVLLVLALFFLISCVSDNSIPTYKIGEPVKTQVVKIQVEEKKLADPCESVSCSDNQFCKEGACVCNADFRFCVDECIPVESCCSSLDCDSREVCVQNKCEQVKHCDYGQKWNAEKRICECDYGFKYCADQQSCVPANSCCNVRDCNTEGFVERLCLPSIPQLYTCVKTEKGSHCTLVTENVRSSFSIIDYKGDVFLLNVGEDSVSDFRIETLGTEYFLNNVNIGESVVFAGGIFTLTTEKVSVKGGTCSS